MQFGDVIQAVIADMDGVLWRGSEVLPGVVAFFDYLKAQGIPFVFATNNSSRTVAYYLEKLAGVGVPVQAEQIISSAVATADYLAVRYPPQTSAYVVGEVGLIEGLRESGFRLINHKTDEADEIEQPQLVVAGLDRAFSYDKLNHAAHYIRNGAVFIGSNSDATFPMPNSFAPGAGSILAAIETASGVKPFVIGKPATPMFEIALARLGYPAEQTLMIGDRLETDINGAAALGLKTALVLSGVATVADISQNEFKPDGIYDDLAHLLSQGRQP